MTHEELNDMDVVTLADVLRDTADSLFARFITLHDDYLSDLDNRLVIEFRLRLDRDFRAVNLNSRQEIVEQIEKYISEREAMPSTP